MPKFKAAFALSIMHLFGTFVFLEQIETCSDSCHVRSASPAGVRRLQRRPFPRSRSSSMWKRSLHGWAVVSFRLHRICHYFSQCAKSTALALSVVRFEATFTSFRAPAFGSHVTDFAVG
jgi:hypothetical protein